MINLLTVFDEREFRAALTRRLPDIAYQPHRWRIHRPVYWEGRQWAITGYGLENVAGGREYPVSWAELFDGQPWLSDLSQKNWVDAADLQQALKYAIKHRNKRKPSRLQAAGLI